MSAEKIVRGDGEKTEAFADRIAEAIMNWASRPSGTNSLKATMQQVLPEAYLLPFVYTLDIC